MADNRETAEDPKGIWRLIDRIQGDKVVWMILILLILFSIVSIFSSTTQLANMTKGVSRINIFLEQLQMVAVGLGFVFIVYLMPVKWIRNLSGVLGFTISIALLSCLLLDIGTEEKNQAVRSVKFGPLPSIHVYEVVKVAMVLYIAWASDEYKNGGFKFLRRLTKAQPKLAFLDTPLAKRAIFIYAPIIVTFAMILPGGMSSAIFIGGIMALTAFIGGIDKRDVAIIATGIAVFFGVFASIFYISDGEKAQRFGTFVGRTTLGTKLDTVEMMLYGEMKMDRVKFADFLNDIMQPQSAKIAIHEGGLLGKGPGNSTQKYSVRLMFSDFMFSFILEEYGLWGGILVMILYVSLLARGILIVRHCDDTFDKVAVGGLTLLITCQALMHIFINLDMGILTGQTLPMISHGNSSLLCFCIAFGVILRISKKAYAPIREETEAAPSLMPEEQTGPETASETENGK